MNEKHRKMYARLHTVAKLSEARLRADPIPHLDRAAKRIYELEKAIEEALILLSGAVTYDIAREIAPRMDPSLVETITVRNTRAYECLRKVWR